MPVHSGRIPSGPLRRSPDHPNYFADAEGNAVYLTGSHTWATMQDMWVQDQPRRNMDYDGFLTMLTDYGHNFLRFWQWMHPQGADWSDVPSMFDPQPHLRTGPGLARDGLPKFDLSQPNPGYFERLRERVRMAGERGIYVSVMLFEAWTIKWPRAHTNPWPYHPMHPDNNVNGVTDDPVIENGWAYDVFSLNCPQLNEWQKLYVKWVVEAVNEFDHVLFEVANEVPDREEAYVWTEKVIDWVREIEAGLPKQHMVGFTSEGGAGDNDRYFGSNADWISPSGGVMSEYRYDPPEPKNAKVVLTDTDHMWGHGGDVRWIWKSFCRGLNVLFMDPWEPIPGDLDWWFKDGVPMNRRYYWAWDDLRRNMGYTRAYALRMNLNRAQPASALTTSRYCLADPGQTYLFFFPEGGDSGIDLRSAAGMYHVEWFDPARGTRVSAAELKGGQSHVVGAPFAGPAVLFLQRKAE
jgi:hypothetical protein